MNIFYMARKMLAYPIYLYGINYNGYSNRARNEYLILMYHRVIEKSDRGNYLQDGMYVTPNTFRMQIEYLTKKFNIVPLSDISNIKNISKLQENKPSCILTFDDGWKDNYTYAYPILKQYHACATIFLTTGYVGTNRYFWTDRLAMLLKDIGSKKSSYGPMAPTINIFVNQLENLGGSIVDKVEKAITILKKLSHDDIERILDEITCRWNVDINIKDASFLSWDEIREMFLSGIIKFGSHTHNHSILTNSSKELIARELTQSRDMLINKNVLSESFIPFAYPNGNYTDEIIGIVKDAGYSMALTTEKGWNPIGISGKYNYKLKRIGIHQDMTSTNAMFGCKILGLY